MNWRPIATAPKDGSEILISREGQVAHVVFFDDDPTQPTHPWSTADGICYHLEYPTHWMPIPQFDATGGTTNNT